MKSLSVYLMVCFVVGSMPGVLCADGIPNAKLLVTVQQREEGKLNRGFHILELQCWEGRCSLSTVSLNQCVNFERGKSAFYPAVQYSSTWLGNLTVWNERNSLVVQEVGSDAFGEYVNTLRFEYEPVGRDKVVTRMVGFSGGYVKNSVLLKKILTTEYVPLPQSSQVMKLDCDAYLPGLDRK